MNTRMAYHKISQNSWTTGIHKFLKLAFHKEEDITSDSIQNLVKEIIAYAHGNVPSELVLYKNPAVHISNLLTQKTYILILLPSLY